MDLICLCVRLLHHSRWVSCGTAVVASLAWNPPARRSGCWHLCSVLSSLVFCAEDKQDRPSHIYTRTRSFALVSGPRHAGRPSGLPQAPIVPTNPSTSSIQSFRSVAVYRGAAEYSTADLDAIRIARRPQRDLAAPPSRPLAVTIDSLNRRAAGMDGGGPGGSGSTSLPGSSRAKALRSAAAKSAMAGGYAGVSEESAAVQRLREYGRASAAPPRRDELSINAFRSVGLRDEQAGLPRRPISAAPCRLPPLQRLTFLPLPPAPSPRTCDRLCSLPRLPRTLDGLCTYRLVLHVQASSRHPHVQTTHSHPDCRTRSLLPRARPFLAQEKRARAQASADFGDAACQSRRAAGSRVPFPARAAAIACHERTVRLWMQRCGPLYTRLLMATLPLVN